MRRIFCRANPRVSQHRERRLDLVPLLHFELPGVLQPPPCFKDWTDSLETQGVIIESFAAGWREALVIAERLDKVIATDTLPPWRGAAIPIPRGALGESPGRHRDSLSRLN